MHAIFGPHHEGTPVTDDEVADAYPWPGSGPWVRAMMVTTLDGAATGPGGVSGSISSEADQAVFAATRRFADVVLIGSGTLRAEKYGPMRAKEADAVRRSEAGQRPAPVLAVVSGSLDLPWRLPVWAESTHRPLVLTRTAADPERLDVAKRHADVVTLDVVTPRAIVDALVGRGLRRIVCEGGPRLLRDFNAADAIDEADITISPTFAGTGPSPTTAGLPDVVRHRLVHVLQGDGFLMARYLAPGR
ncbi:pyrimidine reductase family protein [Actinoallomurus bryophytorum]|uniref:Riboflavin biosynthesis pyrimidine reductase n=1 Tax=Actinoallomurus bryophytorum TaxID=1490222 RepID=A0A543CK20_9ACTN|nr:dihydrofolate reductase family protein [Actinoallomurus bryophytorum]TQL97405.1 riboflavin biosynthesis pyrimidine reductase [Actinoallomurus bryophytorum]